MEHLNVRINHRSADFSNLVIDAQERQIIRGLALKLADIAARPEQDEKKRLWLAHNSLKPTRPVIFCDPENGWNEIMPDSQLQCKNEVARFWEASLKKNIFWGESMGDDRVIEPFFDVPHIYRESDWGMHEKKIGGLDGGSYVWEAPLQDFADIDKIHAPSYDVDFGLTQKVFELAQEILGDILHVRIKTVWFWSNGLTDELANLRGLETVMLDAYDHPDELHQLMAVLRDGTLEKLDFLEKNGLLSLNNDDTFVGSGGFGWTTELPGGGFKDHVRLSDIWGLSESQITVGFSPTMFKEFIFPYQLPIIKKFGLACYGCCEPLDKRWETVKEIPNLRRVSVSPWANVEEMAENLGDKYICSVKPHPGMLATAKIDEEYIRKEMRDIIRKTRGCRVELCMKDNHTLGNNPENVVRWCRIAQEEAENV